MTNNNQTDAKLFMGIHRSDMQRYFQFTILLLAAGSIYPLLYLRQNFETPILEAFGITTAELGQYYSWLGVMYIVTYLPSGWLADKISPKLLVTFSMASTGLLGLWFSTIPGKSVLPFIFIGWGITAGLTFWASLLKGVQMLAKKNEKGRFFGILEGCRGLVEALLATAAVALFAYLVDKGISETDSLPSVIRLYVYNCFALAVLCLLFLKSGNTQDSAKPKIESENPLKDVFFLAKIPELWLMAIIILTGYQLFWATYSFSAFLQDIHGATAVTAAFITVAKLWMRPIGGIGAGILGDKYGKENILVMTLLGSCACLLVMIIFPRLNSVVILLGIILLVGLLTYATRGLYWSILDSCNVPERITGLAIGVISLIAYTPDIYLPLLNGYLSERYEGRALYNLYFGYIGISGFAGVLAALALKRMGKKRRLAQSGTAQA